MLCFLKLKLQWIFKAKSWPEHITNVYSLPESLIPPHFYSQNQDMRYDVIVAGMIEIQS